MRLLLISIVFLSAPVMTYAQSTVGNVPSNPNAMPSVDGSSAAPVQGAGPGTTATVHKPPATTHRHGRKTSPDPH